MYIFSGLLKWNERRWMLVEACGGGWMVRLAPFHMSKDKEVQIILITYREKGRRRNTKRKEERGRKRISSSFKWILEALEPWKETIDP